MVGRDQYRTLNGAGNNPENPDYGTPGSQLLRFGEATYLADGSSIDDAGLTNPREISNIVVAQDTPKTAPIEASALFVFWGQFVDHDLSLTFDTGPEMANVPVAEDDVLGVSEILVARSQFDPRTGTDQDNPRQQITSVTSFIDGSMVYGSDDARNQFLRSEGGKLKVGDGDTLPLNDGSQAVLPADPNPAFVAGDIRANENIALTSLHTLFVREHNRLVDEIAEAHPEYDAETLYQEAKVLNEAFIQNITYSEFLPMLLGPGALPAYDGYDPDIDPGISNLFSAAAFRVGHTFLPPSLGLKGQIDNQGQPAEIALRDAFFRPTSEFDNGVMTALLPGLAGEKAEKFDTLIVDDVRNFLIGEGSGTLGFDLAALNIQRGRDHGLPKYNDAREAVGLDRHDDFSAVTKDIEVQNKLAMAYETVDEMDVWIGGIAEDPVDGAMIGELFRTVISDQFARSRDGDSFFYETRLHGEDLKMVESTTLSDIIERNTEIDDLQANVFLVPDPTFGGTAPDIWA